MSHADEIEAASYCEVCGEVLYPGRPHANCVEVKRAAQINPSAEDIHKSHARETQEKFSLADKPPDAEMKAGLEIKADSPDTLLIKRLKTELSRRSDIIDKQAKQLDALATFTQYMFDSTIETCNDGVVLRNTDATAIRLKAEQALKGIAGYPDTATQGFLPKDCPSGGEHKWNSACSKCGMKILYNPDAIIGSEAQEYPR